MPSFLSKSAEPAAELAEADQPTVSAEASAVASAQLETATGAELTRLELREQPSDADLAAFATLIKQDHGIEVSENPFDSPMCEHGLSLEVVMELANEGQPLGDEHAACSRAQRLYEFLCRPDNGVADAENETVARLQKAGPS